MSVKSRATSPSPIQTSAGSPLPHAVRNEDTSGDKETGPEGQVVDFSSGKIMTAIGYFMCLIILAANLYVLATL